MKMNRKSSPKDLNKLINSFTLYKFITDVTSNYSELEPFQKKLIDGQGNFIGDENKISPYFRLIINIKKLLDKIPNPDIKSRLKNVATAIPLFAEEIDRLGGNSEIVLNEIKDYLINNGLDLTEEMSVGGGGIAGVTPVNSEGNPDKTGLPNPMVVVSRAAQRRHVRKNKIMKRKGY